jgi:hypothetical protein
MSYACSSESSEKISVADPTQFDAVPDLDLAFQLEANPDLTFHFDANPDPDPAPHKGDANLRPLALRSSTTLG